MKRAFVWVLSCVGFAMVLWLLLAPPDSGYERTECHSVLGTNTLPVRGLVDEGAARNCATRQTTRVGWAVLIGLPTAVLTSTAATSRRP
ncbi:hypothetical protein OG558_19370 [Kribbella sp. NBC_01510]|uniref:hypothetical protein n=1 Tax=Kribbella sp. NBC_01510 TaxID=2903581 RepID=UPI003866FB57